MSQEIKLFELSTLLIAFILGWLLYLTIAFRIRSEMFPEMSSQTWYSKILRVVTKLEEKVFFTLAVSLLLLIVLSFSIKVILSID